MKVSALLLRFAAIAGLLYVALFVYVAISRISYPYELEWMEGGMLDQIGRVLTGLPLYTHPSVSYVPFIYPPLYTYLSAGCSLLIGAGFLPLRLISLCATLGCFVVLYMFARRETGSAAAGAIAAGLFAAMFEICGSWFDIARIDSLFLLFILLGAYLLRFRTGARGIIISGLMYVLALFTKQSANVTIIAFTIFLLLTVRDKSRWYFPAVVILAGGGAVVLLQWLNSGWYFYYVFLLPLKHASNYAMIEYFFLRDIGLRLLPGCAVALAGLAAMYRHRTKPVPLFYVFLTAGMAVTALVSRIHRGGYVNVLMPVCAVIALMAGIACGTFAVRRKHRGEEPESDPAPPSRLAGVLAFAIPAFCIFQFSLLWYSPVKQIPSPADRRGGDALVRTVAAIPGEVYLPFHGHLGPLAGKSTFAHAMAIDDILYSSDDRMRNALMSDISAAIVARKFSAIISDQPFFSTPISENYRYAGRIFDTADVFWPVVGYKVRPTAIFLARKGD